MPPEDIETHLEMDDTARKRGDIFDGTTKEKSKFKESINAVRALIQQSFPGQKGGGGGRGVTALTPARKKAIVDESIEFAHHLARQKKSFADATDIDAEIFLTDKASKSHATTLNFLKKKGRLPNVVADEKQLISYAEPPQYVRKGFREEHIILTDPENPQLQITQTKTGGVKQAPLTKKMGEMLGGLIDRVKGFFTESGGYEHKYMFRDTNGIAVTESHFKQIFNNVFW